MMTSFFNGLLNKYICKKNRVDKCSFCGSNKSDKNSMISGEDVNICSLCVYSGYKILFGSMDDKEVEEILLNGFGSDKNDIDFFASIRK